MQRLFGVDGGYLCILDIKSQVVRMQDRDIDCEVQVNALASDLFFVLYLDQMSINLRSTSLRSHLSIKRLDDARIMRFW